MKDRREALADDPHTGRLMFSCSCGCCQSHSDDDEIGIPIHIAERIGWVFTDDGWSCPKCMGNDHMLTQIFHGEFDAPEEELK